MNYSLRFLEKKVRLKFCPLGLDLHFIYLFIFGNVALCNLHSFYVKYK